MKNGPVNVISNVGAAELVSQYLTNLIEQRCEQFFALLKYLIAVQSRMLVAVMSKELLPRVEHLFFANKFNFDHVECVNASHPELSTAVYP